MADNVVKKSLKYSIYDGAAFAVMDGLTSSFLTPFAIASNASVNFIAALTYMPQLIGAFVQLLAANPRCGIISRSLFISDRAER